MAQEKASRLDAELVKFLKRTMAEQNWSYIELAANSGVSRSALYRIIAGERLSTLRLVERISDNLGIPIASIFPSAFKKR